MWRFWWIIALPLVGALVWEGGQWATDNGLVRAVRILGCRTKLQPCKLDYPVIVRMREDAGRAIDLAGRRVFIGGKVYDDRFPQHRAELERRIAALGGAVVGAARDAELQLSLVYEIGTRNHSPYLPGWGYPSRFVAIDLSRVRPSPSTATYAGRDRLAYEDVRQVHFFLFGVFLSMDVAVGTAIDLMFEGLGDTAPPPYTTARRSIDFASAELW